jgi:hypothetical protein
VRLYLRKTNVWHFAMLREKKRETHRERERERRRRGQTHRFTCAPHRSPV